MANQFEHIVNDLKECFDGQPWYGISVMAKLDAIDWQYVNEKPLGCSKSIAILVRHMISWRTFVLKKLEGDAFFDIEINSPSDWSEIHIKNQQEWEQLKIELRQTQKEIIRILSTSESTLLSNRVPGKEYRFDYLIKGISKHDIYHLGQIALVHTKIKTKDNYDSVI